MPELYDELNKLAEGNMYPFHMPGHKRNSKSTQLQGAFRCDITEIDGFDNLHDEKGIILRAEQRAARIYGSDETHFLVNGSTAGVLSSVSALADEGDTVLAARGSHRSLYHAAYLRNCSLNYLPIKIDRKYGIPQGYNSDAVENALDQMKIAPKAVFITSPTYEGLCSDVEGISKLCHKRGIPLIVDAAHGAHFGTGSDMPKGAVEAGADVVIHSVHKTLPSMTQTALLHINGSLVDREKIRRFTRIYQSSSPSYVLMASIDLCMEELEKRRDEFVSDMVRYRKMLSEASAKWRYISIPEISKIPDPAKALIYVEADKMTGQELYDILRDKYDLQLEMAGERYALAIITGWDKEEGIIRLIDALGKIDTGIADRENSFTGDGTCFNSLMKYEGSEVQSDTFAIPKTICSIKKAWDSDREYVLLDDAKGRVAGEFINLYPPGIPLIVPGELINRDIIEKVNMYLNLGMNVQGVTDVGSSENNGIIRTDRRRIVCVRQK
ncbi:MAG: aminotransferase class I/II-fold pyridoxal phosphate-dependent enzyme [Butyrivibrio sp.]|nr:aminotransferase class I/II-fold pyridoxal phosphate-dependent enzyme [Butyrivibrio sp.]